MRTCILSLLIATIALQGCKRETPPPTSKPASQPATTRLAKAPTTSYVDVIRQHYPKLPATQPLGVPVDLKDAGHYLLPEPIYLCPRGDLWITRNDAPAVTELISKAADEQVHLTRDLVRYVHWAGNDEENKPLTRVVVHRSDGSDAWIDRDGNSVPLPKREYNWLDAIGYNDAVVVPCAHGVSVFTFSPDPREIYQEMLSAAGANPPRVLLDPRGVLAWSPWDGSKSGTVGAWRFVEGKWIELKDPNWSAKFVHLVPLLDGSVLQLIRNDVGKTNIALATVDAPTADEAAINKLIDQLSDDDPAKRDAAYAELTRYGPASWPILEKQLADQPPEARIRMQTLLKNKIQPTLGGRKLLDGVIRVADRLDDGGVVLYAPGGVSISREDKPPEVVKPAWISLRPGRPIELLQPVLTVDASPDRQHFFAFDEEWVVSDTVQGPRRFMGNHLEPMLRKDEASYWFVAGYDRRGRWLVRKSRDARETLLVDPTLPDPTPRLPVWLHHIENGTVGWTSAGWPVIKSGGAWVLIDNGWRPLDDKKEVMWTKLRPGDKPTAQQEQDIATSRPSTTRSTTTQAATTTAPAATQETAILVDSQGNRWFDGKERLRVIDRNGKVIDWRLPGTAASVSDFPPVLIRTADGTLFLFNQRGRVVRIKPTPDGPQPFVVEAIFTRRIPTSDNITRIWLDPAGRIIIAYEGNRLAILFPQGRIPYLIEQMMSAKELDDQP